MRGFPVTTAGRLTMGAMVGMAITHFLATLALGDGLTTFAIIFEVVMLGLAALVMVGRWWSYAVVASMAGLLFVATVSGSIDRLRDTQDPAFLTLVVFLTLAVVVVVAGIRSAVRARRGSPAAS